MDSIIGGIIAILVVFTICIILTGSFYMLYYHSPVATEKNAAVRINGGIGNQLFQLAALIGYCHRFDLVPILDRSYIEAGAYHHSKTSYENKLFHNIEHRSLGWKPFILHDHTDVKVNTPCLLNGYFQDLRHFPPKEVLSKYIFYSPDIIKNVENKYGEYINADNVALLHIRRGDYLNNPEMYMVERNTRYYIKSLKHIDSMINKPNWKLLVCTNDKPWSEILLSEHSPTKNIVFIRDNDYYEMALMSRIKHLIISNSTFSWWAAYLATDQTKVIAPYPWTKYYPDGLYPENWIRLTA